MAGKDYQVSFRLVTMKARVRHKGHRKYEERLLGCATDLSIPPTKLRRLYNGLRNPVEASYRRIKSLLPFTSPTRFAFRHLVIALAVLLYSLLVSSGLRRSRFARRMLRAPSSGPGSVGRPDSHTPNLNITISSFIILSLRR
ncbi:hypothetical protein [Conexivisphaera calida]|uniref:Transposase ISC1225 n=1 Tax=Conexivisphaera calida TaxID=1874277 RepID=A0A4P2VG39_9ARCH|nr:hypothetical protein [Conexivisphaera calida]BBE42433.1 Transposase ISC1225 [Conexivisphaera calida]